MSEAKDADVDRLTAIKELLDRCIRRPNEQYAYSRCEVCDTAFWDREEHRFGCKLLEWREALRDQSLSQEAVRDEVLEEAARVCDAEAEYRRCRHDKPLPGDTDPTIQAHKQITAHKLGQTIRALKREPNAAAQASPSVVPAESNLEFAAGPAPAAPVAVAMDEIAAQFSALSAAEAEVRKP